MATAYLKPVRIAFVVLSLGALYNASTANAQSIFASCDEALTKFCPNVTPGHGRLTACLYAHEDKVSPSCDAAIAESADLIDLLFDNIRYVKQQCGEDVAKLCGEVEIGQGRLFSCLYEKRQSLSGECLEVIENVRLPSE